MTVRSLSDLLSSLSNTRHGNEAQDLRDVLASVFPPQFSGVRLIKTGDQGPIANATTVTVTWEATDFDTDSYADLANNRLVIPATDYYDLSTGLVCSGGGTTSNNGISVNGTSIAAQAADSGTLSPSHAFSTGPLLLTSGDLITATIFQATGRTLLNNQRTFLSLVRLGQAPA